VKISAVTAADNFGWLGGAPSSQHTTSISKKKKIRQEENFVTCLKFSLTLSI